MTPGFGLFFLTKANIRLFLCHGTAYAPQYGEDGHSVAEVLKWGQVQLMTMDNILYITKNEQHDLYIYLNFGMDISVCTL